MSEPMLYIFGGFPKNKLSAGGVQYVAEDVEDLGLFAHDPAIEFRKEGIFIGEKQKEFSRPFTVRISEKCLLSGISWDWFPENWSFGNGCTVHMTHASPVYKTVIHGTTLTEDEYLDRRGPTPISGLTKSRMQVWLEGWAAYEARWVPATCPKYNHLVYLTWFATDYRLPDHAYRRLRDIIEGEATINIDSRYYANVTPWSGTPLVETGAL